ncbi:MAG: ABC transporter permease subunit [Ruminococcus sp.]|nr:ABC transporter permease subunit [Ruminococcus sp.]MCM1380796.1 ABC transporter permease subunit [Muribaculaceae bacterium]MCM1478489.1 ABC transporter permease subunit [Muribaculaceae bacterium]
MAAKAIDIKKNQHIVVKTPAEKAADVLYWILRTAIIANIIMLFFPAFNPARLSGLINKNLSLFSCGISYDSIVANFGRALRQGWVLESTFKTLSALSAVIIFAILLAAVGGCMSLGNRRMKKLGCAFTLVGGIAELIAILGINGLYDDIVEQARAADKVKNVAPQLPNVNSFFLILAIAFIAISVINFLLVPRDTDGKFEMEPKFQLFLMMLPAIALAFVFSYLPLYGWRYAFFEYNAGESLTMDKFAGFKWFTSLFQNAATRKDMVTVLKNTLGMSGLGILTSWLPMAFAIFLSEIKNQHFRRFVQTFTTIPNFISWVLVYALALALFSTDGFINTMINNISDAGANTNYLMSDSHSWLKMLAWGTWKGIGWSAIIYIAAISGIDQGLYEAATVDGAGRFARMWHITVPELIPTYCVLLLMSIANILSNGMEQYMVFSNPMNERDLQVLDLYVYNLGIGKGLIPLSTVIGMVKSVISVTLLFAANGVSKAVRGESIV